MTSPRAGRLPSWALGDAARVETDRSGKVVAWNPAAEELYGYEASEAIGRPVVALIVPARARQQALEIMDSLAVGRSWEGEFEARRRDGRVLRVLIHSAPVYDDEDTICGAVGHSAPLSAQSPRPAAARVRVSPGAWTHALRTAMLDSSVGVGAPLRARLLLGGVALELVWALAMRWAGRGEAVGVAGAVGVMIVIAIAMIDAWAGFAVALIASVMFVVVVGYADPPAPAAFGAPLVAVWIVSALAAGVATVRLREQVEHGVAEAVALHRELVGSLVPAPSIRRVDVSISTLYRPGEQRLELGGDFYAAVERADRGIALMVGDVSGHGPEAAATAAMLRAGWEALVEAGVAPQDRLRSLNRLLLSHARFEELFATVCSVVIEPGLSEATIAIAGHPPPILMSNGIEIPIGAPTGMPLGVSETAQWTPARVSLPQPFSLLLYTDGVIEGRAAPGDTERFGEERLHKLVTDSPATGRELLVSILHTAAEAQGGPLPDDAALLLIESRDTGDVAESQVAERTPAQLS
jgi:PAS domain S-box-containing protein